MICYWKDSGFFDSIKTPDWKCDNELKPGGLESKAQDSLNDGDAQRFRREVFELNSKYRIPAVDYISDSDISISKSLPDCSKAAMLQDKPMIDIVF